MADPENLLSVVVFLPTLGALFLLLFPSGDRANIKATAIGVSALTFAVSLFLMNGFDFSNAGYQFAQSSEWIEAFGIRYSVGLDGISLVLVVLTTAIIPLTLLGSWRSIHRREKEFVIAVLLLETGMLGAFAALDLFLFYVFWEAMLIPMYFLVGIWGGPRRVYAAVKFFIYTMAGSLLMLIAILFVAYQPGGNWDFALSTALARTDISGTKEMLLFLAFALAFAIKVPMFPFHTWLPDAHVEAPTPGSVILAAVLLKLGVYGYLRFAMPLFPEAAMQALPYIGWLSVIGIVYGALVAWVQPDMKKLVAYSSVSHLGFCMLGLAALTEEAVSGAVFVMIAHGVSTGALFLLVGILYERRHTRMLADYGGIAKVVPVYACFLVATVMASAGLPLLSGFPGEFLVLLGTYTSGGTGIVWAICAATGVILAAVYLLVMVQRVLFGPLVNPANQELKDLNLREWAVLTPFLVMAVVLGTKPNLLLDPIRPSVQKFIAQVHRRDASPPQVDRGFLSKKVLNAPALQQGVPIRRAFEVPGGGKLQVRPNTPLRPLLRGGFKIPGRGASQK